MARLKSWGREGGREGWVKRGREGGREDIDRETYLQFVQQQIHGLHLLHIPSC